MIRKFHIYLLLVSIVISSSLFAQQDNLWSTEFGSRSALVAGSVTASVRDNSAIYYNPGALGFMKNSNIGLSANIATLQNTYLKNGGGDGINLYYPHFSIIPQFVSGILKLEKIPKVTFTYSVFNKHKSKLNFREIHSGKKDLYGNDGIEELFNSKYEYLDRIEETWIGIGAGYLLSKKWAVGASLFFSYMFHDSYEGIETNVIGEQGNLMASTSFTTDMRMTQLAIILKIGVAYEDEYISWGATATSTGIPTYFFDGSYLSRKEIVYVPGSPLHNFDVTNEWTHAWYKHPWEFDSGVQFALLNSTLNFRISYFTGNSPYAITEFDEDAVIISNSQNSIYPEWNKVMYASKPVINFAIGYEKRINEKLDLLTGFKVDRNAFDSDNLDRNKYWVPTKSYWNLYNATVGFDYRTKNSNSLIFGITYKFTNRKGDDQFVNLTDPDPDNYLQGEIKPIADTNISGFSLIVGYTYNFGEVVKKDIRGRIKLNELNPFDKDNK